MNKSSPIKLHARAVTRAGLLLAVVASAAAQDTRLPLPFGHKIEVFRNKDDGVMVFVVRLEQAFLAEEFETSNDLRLQPLDDHAFLTYPKQARFESRHASFYGRLRGEGLARIRIAYETVTENLDGSRNVVLHHGDLEIPIPSEPTGTPETYLEWARQQNLHFRARLDQDPTDSFLQFVLLQSRQRYGVTPPPLPPTAGDQDAIEAQLYTTFSTSLGLQQALQRSALSGTLESGAFDVHISGLTPPAPPTVDFAKLLDERRQAGATPVVLDLARYVPADQYLLAFHTLDAALELYRLAHDWGDGLWRLKNVTARDDELLEKFERQLILPHEPLARLFREGVIRDIALTGADVSMADGADLTVLLRLDKPETFHAAAEGWLASATAADPQIELREFNYRGMKVAARYRTDRTVSSFVVSRDDCVIVSNSHAAIRRIVHVLGGADPALADQPDYLYLSTLLPPGDGPDAGYFVASEAFLRRLIGPEHMISAKRRKLCFNNLVMLNNASLLFRMETGRSPAALTELVQGKYIDPARLVCPHGGNYSIDAQADCGTCSLHNRLALLTPTCELTVLKVTNAESAEYGRLCARGESFWKEAFHPLALRIHAPPPDSKSQSRAAGEAPGGPGDATGGGAAIDHDRAIRFEFALLPSGEGVLADLRNWTAEKTPVLAAPPLAHSAIASLRAAPGSARIAEQLRGLPGIPGVLRADPTLTDLKWLGDGVSLHLCDHDTILEVDPGAIRPINLFGPIDVIKQSLAAAAVLGMSVPAYATIDILDRDKAQRFLDLLASRIFLESRQWLGIDTTLDAYRNPDIDGLPNYVISYQLHALKVRLHVALTDGHLVIATKEQTLREVIAAARADDPAGDAGPGPGLSCTVDFARMNALLENLRLYWGDKTRRACHGNVMTLQELAGLYAADMPQVVAVARGKYGVTLFCPDGGGYAYDPVRDVVACSVHGNRQDSRQNPAAAEGTSFQRFIGRVGRVRAALGFEPDWTLATLEVERR